MSFASLGGGRMAMVVAIPGVVGTTPAGVLPAVAVAVVATQAAAAAVGGVPALLAAVAAVAAICHSETTTYRSRRHFWMGLGGFFVAYGQQ